MRPSPGQFHPWGGVWTKEAIRQQWKPRRSRPSERWERSRSRSSVPVRTRQDTFVADEVYDEKAQPLSVIQQESVQYTPNKVYEESGLVCCELVGREPVADRAGEIIDNSCWSGKLNVEYAVQSQKSMNELYVTGLPTAFVNEVYLWELFVSRGFSVTSMRMGPDMEGQCCSSAMVQLISFEEAHAAMKALNGLVLTCPT